MRLERVLKSYKLFNDFYIIISISNLDTSVSGADAGQKILLKAIYTFLFIIWHIFLKATWKWNYTMALIGELIMINTP